MTLCRILWLCDVKLNVLELSFELNRKTHGKKIGSNYREVLRLTYFKDLQKRMKTLLR